MTDNDFGVDFFMEWASINDTKMTLKEGEREVDQREKNKAPRKQGSRLAGESLDQRERRLSQARECSSRRRSTETQEDREKRLKDQRERMSSKRQSESEEERRIRLAKARERESLRRRNETLDKREMRLQYSRKKAAIRRNEETPEERERRLDASRIRASQRRREKKNSKTQQLDSSSSSFSELTPKEQKPAAPPRNQRVTRQSVQQESFYTIGTVEQETTATTMPTTMNPSKPEEGERDEGRQEFPFANNNNNYKASGGGGGGNSNYFNKSGPSLSMPFVIATPLPPTPPPPPPPAMEPPRTSMVMTSELIQANTHSHSLSSGLAEERGSRTGGGGGGGGGGVRDELLGGIGLGFLERRHNHPDFNMGDQRIVVVKNI